MEEDYKISSTKYASVNERILKKEFLEMDDTEARSGFIEKLIYLNQRFILFAGFHIFVCAKIEQLPQLPNLSFVLRQDNKDHTRTSVMRQKTYIDACPQNHHVLILAQY